MFNIEGHNYLTLIEGKKIMENVIIKIKCDNDSDQVSVANS